MKNGFISKAKTKAQNTLSKFQLGFASGCASAMVMANSIQGHCAIQGFEGATITNGNADPATMMGDIIGVILTIMRYAGVVLVIYGIYEIIMSIMNNQPEAKTKGIFMAMAGVVLIALKSILQGLGVIGN